MSDALLPHFRRELDALRRLGGEFAEAHPKIAGRLRLGADGADDPHVERLLEGVAFLAARVQHRLDDEFPELTDALLGVLYPHYLAPVPSMAIVVFAESVLSAGRVTRSERKRLSKRRMVSSTSRRSASRRPGSWKAPAA